MEVAFASGNSCQLFRLIRTISGRRATVSESVTETDGSLIHNKQRRLSRWAEHFEQELGWPPAPLELPPCVSPIATWDVRMDPPSTEEIRACIGALKRRKAASSDDLVPVLLKEGGEALLSAITQLFGLVWENESVPED